MVQGLTICPACDTPHHSECWEANGSKCSIYGCGAAGASVVTIDFRHVEPLKVGREFVNPKSIGVLCVIPRPIVMEYQDSFPNYPHSPLDGRSLLIMIALLTTVWFGTLMVLEFRCGASQYEVTCAPEAEKAKREGAQVALVATFRDAQNPRIISCDWLKQRQREDVELEKLFADVYKNVDKRDIVPAAHTK